MADRLKQYADIMAAIRKKAKNGESTFSGHGGKAFMPLQGAREGLLEKLEAVLTRGKGSASGSRFAEESSGKDLLGESVGVR